MASAGRMVLAATPLSQKERAEKALNDELQGRKKVAEETLDLYRARYWKMPRSIYSLKQLPAMDGLDELIVFEKSHQLKYPILTNDYYASLIDPSNIDDPLRRIVVPSVGELEATKLGVSAETGLLDTSGEVTNEKAPGLQHKYAPTALALTSNACFGLCRECFRKRLFLEGKMDMSETVFPNHYAVSYLKAHHEINTILLTGGDVLRLSTDCIRDILTILSHPDLEHITTVRIGTKGLAFYPQRVDEDLCQVLEDFQESTGKSVHVCTHFELAREVTSECIEACRRLRRHSIELYNQTVLLAGINDDADTLCELWEAIQKAGVRPYFLFQCRPVLGTKEMHVSLKRGIEIVAECNRRTTGVHKPRYAMSTIWGKMEIMGVNSRNPDEVVLRQHSAKNPENTGDVIFYNVEQNDAYWFYADDHVVKKAAVGDIEDL